MKANRHRGRKAPSAFSLLEVMVALGIFFMAVFAILGVITNGMRNARTLQQKDPDAGMVAAEITVSNALVEQLESAQFSQQYAGYSWTRDTYEVLSNKLFQVDMIVQKSGADGKPVSKLSILLFRPQSKPGSLDGALPGS